MYNYKPGHNDTAQGGEGDCRISAAVSWKRRRGDQMIWLDINGGAELAFEALQGDR